MRSVTRACPSVRRPSRDVGRQWEHDGELVALGVGHPVVRLTGAGVDHLDQSAAERFDAGACDLHVVDLDVGYVCGSRSASSPSGAGSTRGTRRHDRAQLDPVGRGLDASPTPSTACQNSASLGGSAASTTTARNHPTGSAMSVLHPVTDLSGHPPIVRPVLACPDRADRRPRHRGPIQPRRGADRVARRSRRGRRTTRTCSRRTRCSASRASTRRARRWSRRPGRRSTVDAGARCARRPRHRRRRGRASPTMRSSRAHPTRDRAPGWSRCPSRSPRPARRVRRRRDPGRDSIGLGATASPGRIVGPPRHGAVDGPPTTRLVNERYRAEIPTLLAGSLAHDLLWSGPDAGQYEEVVLHALVATGAPPAAGPDPRARARGHGARPPPELARDHAAQLPSSGTRRHRAASRPTAPAPSPAVRRACRRPTSGASRS